MNAKRIRGGLLLRQIALLLLLSLVLTAFAISAGAIGISIDGAPVAFSDELGQPFIDSAGRTQVPLRAVMEQYGCEVDWNGKTRTATAEKDGITVSVPIGKREISVDGWTIPIDTEAQILNGRTYLPIRAVLEAFGAAVIWNGETKTVDAHHPEAGDLQVHFIDVGQADCILIRSGDDAMLIDAGDRDDAQTIQSYFYAHGISSLKYAIGTHAHADHIGSLSALLGAFTPSRLLLPAAKATSKVYKTLLETAEGLSLVPYTPSFGETIPLGSVTLTTVNALKTSDLNNSSLMFRLVYGETSFLFTGDAETQAEAAAIAAGAALDSDVLKLGHHGSRTSSSPAFLNAVTPDYAVISCGTGNSYGHPHPETIEKLKSAGIAYFRTDEQGSITAISDGTAIYWNVAPAS